MSEIVRSLGSRGRVERELLEAILEELQHVRAASTEQMARKTRGAVNATLAVETSTLDAAGILTRTYGTPIGSVIVSNPGTHAVTVTSGPQQGTSAPAVGTGVFVVPGGSFVGVAIGGPTITLYGTAGDSVGLQVFTGMLALGAHR